MSTISRTPLSDLMALSAADETGVNFGWFVEEFRKSKVGVFATGMSAGQTGEFVSTDARPLFLSSGDIAGDRFLRAFADPVEFARQFGKPFNAEAFGDALIATAMHNPACEGIQVNSAITESSIIIERQTLEVITGKSKPTDRPWWKFWW